MDLVYESSLAHHGVMGMKWGVRRYQPYPSGSKHKGIEVGKAAKVNRREMSDDAKKAKEIRKKTVDEMSNAELRVLNDRDQLEQNHKRLNPNVVKKGLAVAGTLVAATGTLIALYNNGSRIVEIGKNNIKPVISKIGEKVMDSVDIRNAKKLGWY